VFPNILCAVDGTLASFAAVAAAARLAGRDGELTLLVVTAETGGGAYSYAAVSPGRAERVLDSAAAIATKAGAGEPLRMIDPGAPAPRIILQRAAEHDLLALGAPIGTWLGDIMLDGTTVAALRSLTQPLLAVPARAERLAAERQILVASDGLESSDHAVELAGKIARSDGAELALVHAIGPESRVRPHHVHEQVRRLSEIVGKEITTFIEPRRPRAAIVAAAAACKPWLLVMGSRRLDGFAVFGSVSRRVVHDPPCAILLVPPEHRTP
jgi:nucleotide-binding universal stress UspA family protein